MKDAVPLNPTGQPYDFKQGIFSPDDTAILFLVDVAFHTLAKADGRQNFDKLVAGLENVPDDGTPYHLVLHDDMFVYVIKAGLTPEGLRQELIDFARRPLPAPLYNMTQNWNQKDRYPRELPAEPPAAILAIDRPERAALVATHRHDGWPQVRPIFFSLLEDLTHAA